MIKPKPIPKKEISPIRKKQGVHSKKLLRDEKSLFENRTVLLIIILILTFIAFLPSLSNQFINAWDDGAYVTDNPLITHLNWESLKGIFTHQVNGTYVPIPLVSWALEFKVFGLNPFPYHLNNLLLHLLCTTLVFYFLMQLRLPVIYAALGALLFGIHPMRVESVAWVTERKDLLFSLFYLGSLIAYCKYLLNEKEKPKYFIWALLFFVLSLFSKIQAVSLPLTLFLLDYWFARPLKWNLLWEKIPFLVLSLGFGLAGYFILQNTQAIDVYDKYSLMARILPGLFSISVYLFRLVLPLKLSALYPYPVDPGESIPLLYWLNPLLLIAVAILIFFTVRKTRAVVFGSLFFLFNVMFLLQIVRAGQAYQADRFTYIPYIGLFFLAAWAVEKFTSRNRRDNWVVPGLSIVVLAFFFFTTYARCKDWKDNITLWQDVIDKYPSKLPTAYYNLGLAHAKIGQWDKAVDNYSGAIRERSKYAEAYTNRGVAYKNLGQMDKAITDYTKAISIDPEYGKAWYNRGTAYYLLRQLNQAMDDFTKAITLNPHDPEACNNRGIVYNDLGRWDKAMADFSRALEINPDYINAYANRGMSYGSLGQFDKAIADFSRAVELDPKFADGYTNLGNAYFSLGQWDKAIAAYSSALQIDPSNKDAYNNREAAYQKSGMKRQ